jgi:hypothetical protein
VTVISVESEINDKIIWIALMKQHIYITP